MGQFIESSADCYARNHHDPRLLLRAIGLLAPSPAPSPMLSASGGGLGHRVALLTGRRRCCGTTQSTIVLLAALLVLALPIAITSVNGLIDLCGPVMPT